MSALTELTWKGFGIRFLLGLVLVFSSYNPESWSYFHWIKTSFPKVTALQAFLGVVLLIGWAVFIRASLRSLGPVGLALALAFFATMIWLVVDIGLIPADSIRAITYLAEFIIAAILSTGLSWSHVRRRISGQMDTDDV